MLRTYSTATIADYYALFPTTFPKGGPPAASFAVNNKKLRKEYRKLQAANHPDLINNLNKGNTTAAPHISSSYINKAYNTLNDPLKRSQYLLRTQARIDLNSDEATHKYEFADQSMLMNILEIHESLENMKTDQEAETARNENQVRIDSSIAKLNDLYSKQDPNYDDIALETIRLKYWYNIKNVLKEWAPGKPVTLTH